MSKALYGWGVLAGCAAMVTGASAGLVLDQVGATTITGGYNGPVAQSFRPAASNIARIDAFIGGTAALTADVTVTLYSSFSGGTLLTNPIATATLVAVPRGTWAEFIFPPVEVTPEGEYYMHFQLSLLTIGSSRSNPYDRGQVIFGGGNISGGDLAFRTYADDAPPVPAPAAAIPLILGMASQRRRRPGQA